MATLAENAAAVKAAQVAIDAAIVAKGGTTTGGLSNAAAAIEALPSGGDPIKDMIVQSLFDLWNNTTGVTLDFSGLFDSVVGWDTNRPNRGQTFRSTRADEIICPWMNCGAAYCFGGSQYLKKVTINRVGNISEIFASSPNITDINVRVKTSNQMTFTAGLAGISKHCPNAVIHCSDADLKYIDGAWVVVERS